MSREIFNIKTIKEKRFDTIDLGDHYNRLFGQPESKFTAMMYGPSGCGKSVLALQFADYYAQNIGKTLYNSHEERVNQTIKDRINNYNIQSSKLYVGNALNFEEMGRKIEKNYYRAVFIDSIQYMDFSFDELKELRKRFAKRKLAIIMVSFGKVQWSPACELDMLHACDVKCFLKGGNLNVVSRYTSKPVDIRLFSPTGQYHQPSLFN